ncbi:hypothetical protein ASD54_04585 [Rhizobium sp. Root149]|uniref:DUF4062 domain-containing protein n=1 Tax=Rhizobium sp. Root149 TaxID=1736473 RepID=UPI0007128F1B|nr:DUF4062 domain-containing protein [Rhizobium sp. Root149]KQZ54611.1 hypothetical protein ASD54_04585 [Rhizobium sp. Root149]
MQNTRTIIRVFIASPGDLTEERQLAKNVVDEENSNHANFQGYHIELVGWEDTVAQHGRAQEVINRELDQCEFFIGMLWKRWGTAPGASYTSGFEEEFERAQKRFKQTGFPDISMLFKEVSADQEKDAGPQLQRVLDFKKDFADKYLGLYQGFSDSREFERRFRAILSRWLKRKLEQDTEQHLTQDVKLPEISPQPAVAETDRASLILDREALEFVQQLVLQPKPQDAPSYTPTDAARFRLIATTLRQAGNDAITLGPHDANIIYNNLRDHTLSPAERRGLFLAGLRNFESKNTPIWYVLPGNDRSTADKLLVYTIISEVPERKSAFKLLELMPVTIEDARDPFTPNFYLEQWFDKDLEDDLKSSALSYLEKRGSPIALAAIDALIAGSNATISRDALAAKVCILYRQSSEDALRFLASYPEAEVRPQLVEMLFKKTALIPTSVLKACLPQKTPEIRLIVGNELLRRKELSLDDLNYLEVGAHPELMAVSAKLRAQSGSGFSLTNARELIFKGSKPRDLGSVSPQMTEAFFEYNMHHLSQLPAAEIQHIANGEGYFDDFGTIALVDKIYHENKFNIFENIEDEYQNFYNKKYENSFIDLSNINQNVNDYLRNRTFHRTLNIVASKMDSSALKTIRHVIDKSTITGNSRLYKFLSRYGDWNDVRRIIKIHKNFDYSTRSIVDFESQNLHAIAADAILKLGKERYVDLLEEEIPSPLKFLIICRMPNSAFSSFDRGKIIYWLNSEDSQFRRAVALKTVLSYSKSFVSSILDDYCKLPTYYYDCIFWLDLGVSMDVKSKRHIVYSAIEALELTTRRSSTPLGLVL